MRHGHALPIASQWLREGTDRPAELCCRLRCEALRLDLAEGRPSVGACHFDRDRLEALREEFAQLLFRPIRPGGILRFGVAGSLLILVLALPRCLTCVQLLPFFLRKKRVAAAGTPAVG